MSLFPLIALDIETTGMDPKRDRIIEIGAVRFDLDREMETFHTLINPGVKIPDFIARLTGMKDEELSRAPLFSEISQKIGEFLGEAPIMGHNISFDIGFLKTNGIPCNGKSFDTLSLSQILLPKQASYALETLISVFDLPRKPIHRALDDSRSNIDLFFLLLSCIKKLPMEKLKIIRDVLTLSEWGMKELFLNDCAGYPDIPFPAKKRIISTGNAAFASSELTQIVREIFDRNESALIETGSHSLLPFEIFKEKIMIAYGSAQWEHILRAWAEEAPVSSVFLRPNSFYLDPERFKAFLEKPFFEEEETTLALKILASKQEEKPLDRFEIALNREEILAWEEVNAETNDIYQTLIGKAQIYFVHHHFLTDFEPNSDFPKRLIIEETHRLEDHLTHSFTVRLTHERGERLIRLLKRHAEEGETQKSIVAFENTLSIFFGLAGMFLERYRAEGLLEENSSLPILPYHLDTLEWKKLMSSAEHILTLLREIPIPIMANSGIERRAEKFREDLVAFFFPKEEIRLIRWIEWREYGIELSASPLSLADSFQRITAPFSSVILKAPHLTFKGKFDFIKEELGVPENYRSHTISAPSRLRVSIPHDLPDPSTEGYFKKCLEIIRSKLAEGTKKLIVIVSAKKAVEAMLLAAEETHPHYLFFGQGMSGGKGKILTLFGTTEKPSVLFCLPTLLPLLHEVSRDVSTLILQKIPFDHPRDIVSTIRANQYDDGFQSYTLPRGVLRFGNLLRELELWESLTELILLDNRILSKDYGKHFVKF